MTDAAGNGTTLKELPRVGYFAVISAGASCTLPGSVLNPAEDVVDDIGEVRGGVNSGLCLHRSGPSHGSFTTTFFGILFSPPSLPRRHAHFGIVGQQHQV